MLTWLTAAASLYIVLYLLLQLRAVQTSNPRKKDKQINILKRLETAVKEHGKEMKGVGIIIDVMS